VRPTDFVSGSIICGVDDSQSAYDAVRVAKSLASALDRRLVLLHTVRMPIAFGVAAMPHAYPFRADDQRAAQAGERLLERLAYEHGLSASVERRVENGDPSLVLPAVADDEAAGAIVLGSGGRNWLASALLARVPVAVVAHAPCPVIVVPPKGRLGSGAVVCAVDDSAEARGAVPVARGLSDGLGVDLLVAHAVAATPVPSTSAVPSGPAELVEGDRRRAEEFLAGLSFEEGLGTRAERRIAFGSEAEAIADLADDEDAALVVAGSRGRGALKSLVGGSVSLELWTSSSRPVVVVPRGARTRV
jgi:nucleotide-binding universal stress UspA family protein